MLEIKNAVTVAVLIFLKHMVCVGDWHLQNLHRGINIVHKFLSMCNAICMHIAYHGCNCACNLWRPGSDLTTCWHNLLFFFIFIFIFFNFIIFIFCVCIYRKQAFLSYLHSDSNQCCWLAWMNKKYIFII